MKMTMKNRKTRGAARWAVLFLIALAALVPLGVFASPGWAETTYYVARDGNDDDNDGSQGNPFATIQKAVKKINDSLQGEYTISVGAGEYDLNGILTLNGDNYMYTLRGAGSDQVTLTGTIACNAGGLLTIEGFTITGGTGATGGSSGAFYGGGVYMGTGNVIIKNCVFTSNDENVGYGGGVCGGGSADSVTIENCTFKQNKATYGGAVYISVNDENVKVTLTGCVFENNTATQNGGGICVDGGVVEVTNCVFTGNTAT